MPVLHYNSDKGDQAVGVNHKWSSVLVGGNQNAQIIWHGNENDRDYTMIKDGRHYIGGRKIMRMSRIMDRPGCCTFCWTNKR